MWAPTRRIRRCAAAVSRTCSARASLESMPSSTTTMSAHPPSPNWWRWLVLAAAVIVVDLATKAWIVSVFREGQELPVTSFFSLVLAYNTGAAFSFLAGHDGWQRWLFTGIAIIASVFLVWMLRRGGHR